MTGHGGDLAPVPAFWRRPGLDVASGRLVVAGADAEQLAREHGTPLYVIDGDYVAAQARRLSDALAAAGLEPVVRLALKAQRDPLLLAHLRQAAPFLGLDVCSPGEVTYGLAHGFSPGEVSYTGTNVSERDLDVIVPSGVHVNVDLLSQLERFGRRAPGRAVGLRVNPRGGAGYLGEGETLYAGARPTKFGLFAEQLDEAVARAAALGLAIDTVHFHTGDGYLSDGLENFERVVARAAAMARRLQAAGCEIVEVNTGGGLGVAQRDGDEPLDLERWADVLARHLGPLGVRVGTEPGDFLTKPSSVLLAEVVTVEERDGHVFCGLDVGWNVACGHFVYDDPLSVVVCRAADAEPVRTVTVAGNINEGDDLFAEDLPWPEVAEGDIVALLNVGAYNASMTSEHCLRGPVRSLLCAGGDEVAAGGAAYEERAPATAARTMFMPRRSPTRPDSIRFMT